MDLSVETDTSALQDCEVMSADTSTTDLGNGDRSTGGGGSSGQRDDGSMAIPVNYSSSSVYEFEEKDNEPIDYLGKNSSQFLQCKRYNKPKKVWMQKEKEDIDYYDFVEQNASTRYNHEKAKRRRRLPPSTNGGSSCSFDNGHTDFSEGSVVSCGSSRTGHDETESDNFDVSPFPIKLKICRDPNSSGNYRVIPSSSPDNGLVSSGSSPLFDSEAKQVDSCILPDGHELHVGDVVWAKITGYPFWPSRIFQIIHDPNKTKGSECEFNARVDWFAWNQCSYIPCHKLLTFLDNLDSKFNSKSKNKSYIEAVQEAKVYAENRLKQLNEKTAASSKRGRSGNSRRGRPPGSTNKDSGSRSTRGRSRGSLSRNNPHNHSFVHSASNSTISTSHNVIGSNCVESITPCSSSGITDPLNTSNYSWHLPSTTAAATSVSAFIQNGGLSDLPDLGPIEFGDVMKCDIPTFSDDDEDDTANLIRINPDDL